jgi:putative ABC transport system substrate-binding protein
MRRREFVAGLFFATVPGALAQQENRIWRVAYLNPGVPSPATEFIYRSWSERMKQLGYIEGGNLIVDRRYADGDYNRLPQLAEELIARKPDVIMAIATPAIAAAHRATARIPIVMAPATDPVGSGFVKSLAKPGGNVTGVANMSGDYTPKTIELLHEMFPNAKRVAVLMSANATHPMQYRMAEGAATALGLQLMSITAIKESDLDEAFATITQVHCDALLVLLDPTRPRIMRLAADARIPAIYQGDYFVALGGLASYGPDIGALITQSADYIDKILRGASPGDLPVEQPTRFVLKVNLKTAKALELTIAPALLARADEVIE